MTNAAAQNYAVQSLILGIVKSDPFQMRTNLTDTVNGPATTRAALAPPKPLGEGGRSK